MQTEAESITPVDESLIPHTKETHCPDNQAPLHQLSVFIHNTTCLNLGF